jgi:hypothetical protein
MISALTGIHSLESKWNEQFRKLIAYKREHANCNVPNRYRQDPCLATWVALQRTLHPREQLKADRVASLEKIGFRWKSRDMYNNYIQHEVLWQMSYYGKLLPFLYSHGHCRVPSQFTEDPAFGIWVTAQKYRFQKGILSKDRMALLDRVGFRWSREGTTK